MAGLLQSMLMLEHLPRRFVHLHLTALIPLPSESHLLHRLRIVGLLGMLQVGRM